MSFDADLRRFEVKLERVTQAVFADVVAETARSVVDGSEITGAPGQPVDTGNLRASWQTRFVSPTLAEITTNVEYAPFVEDGVGNSGPMRFKNHGPHSVELTKAGFQRIADHVAKAVA